MKRAFVTMRGITNPNRRLSRAWVWGEWHYVFVTPGRETLCALRLKRNPPCGVNKLVSTRKFSQLAGPRGHGPRRH